MSNIAILMVSFLKLSPFPQFLSSMVSEREREGESMASEFMNTFTATNFAFYLLSWASLLTTLDLWPHLKR